MRMDKATDTHVLVSIREPWVGGKNDAADDEEYIAKMGGVKFQ